MSNVTQNSPNNFPPVPNLTDFTALISALNEVTQALYDYSQTPKANKQEQSKNISSCESKDVIAPKPRLSKRAQRKECYKEFCYNHRDTTAFVDKELAQTFKKAYSDGCFRDEIRYYHVPAHIVRYEHKLLKQHQQKDIVSLLSSVCDDLGLRTKLLAYLNKNVAERPLIELNDNVFQSLSLLYTIYGHLNDFTLVHKTMLPLRRKHPA